MRRQLVRALTLALAAVALPAATASPQGAETGAIAGTVTDINTRQPVPDVQIVIVGVTPRGARTGSDGSYRISGVPAGAATVRVMRIGYESQTRPTTVPAGGTVTVDFALNPTVTTLDEVVSSATGETFRKREAGASIATINSENVPLAAVDNFSQILASRAPGVVVQQSMGTTGASSRIRIRGSNSISLVNEPLLIVDGVRATNDAGLDAFTVGIGGLDVSRFDDLNPEEIESVEIIRGAAGVALYGTSAANGVIQVTTKRGRAGRARWDSYAEYGKRYEVTSYPANYTNIGPSTGIPGSAGPISGGVVTPTAGYPDSTCTIDKVARGLCAQQTVASWNPLETLNPFRTGNEMSYGLSVAGGGDAATYYLGGDYDGIQGVYDANNLRRGSLRANVTARPRANLDVTATTSYLKSRTRYPYNDNSAFGTLGNGLLGRPFDDPVTRGYFALPPDVFEAVVNDQSLDRFTGGLSSNYQILPWLRAVGQAGLDMVSRADEQLTPANRVPFNAASLEGNRTSNRYSNYTWSGNGGLTGNFTLMPELVSTTSVGAQYTRAMIRGTEGFGRRLLAGTGSLDGASAGFAVGERNEDVITIGGYVQQQFGWLDRRFLNAAVRGDDDSAFGADFGLVYYPTVGASWVISEESFFPSQPWLGQLRLRSSYGKSGQRPGFRNAETFYDAVAVNQGGTENPGISQSGAGNPVLKPEITSEYEGGLDAQLLGDRLSLEVTGYSKRTRDALVRARLAPSLGATLDRFLNLGEVRNRGIEALVNATLLETAPARLDVTFSFARNSPEVRALGKDAQGQPIAPIIFGSNSTQRHTSGRPPGAYYDYRIVSYNDLNGDGILSRVNCPTKKGVTNPQIAGGPACEVVLGDSAQYLGQPIATREMNINTALTLWNWARVSALVTSRGGNKLLNFTREFRCGGSLRTCPDLNDPSTPLNEQVKAIARLMGTDAGYIEDASFVRLNEVALTLTAPRTLANRFRVAGLGLTIAGRNLAVWSDYSGFDPEVNSTPGQNFTTSDFLTQPPLRSWNTRLSVTF